MSLTDAPLTNWFFGLDMWIILVGMVVLITGAVLVGHRWGERVGESAAESSDIGTLAAGALGLLALLIAFCFSIALNSYDTRRGMVVEEAAAIDSAADQARMLPPAQRAAVLSNLGAYATTRANLGARYDPPQAKRDEARSLVLLSNLWTLTEGAEAATPNTLAVNRFANALEALSVIQEKRIAARHYHIPIAVIAMLVGTSIVAMGFTGFHTGVAGARRLAASLIMAVTLAVSILLIVDIDRPARGSFKMPREAMIGAAAHVNALAAETGGSPLAP
jgi:hypothetical protein